MIRSLRTLFFTAILLTAYRAGAREIYEFYNGVRALGMGGCGVAVVNDETALMVNPAGLGKLRDYILTVVDPELEVGAESSNIVGGNALKSFKPQEVLDMLNAGHEDERLHMKAQLFPSFVAPNFGLGVYMKYQTDAEVDSDTGLFTYDYTNDMAIVTGFNFRFWDGIVKLGFNARVMDRVQILRDDITITATNLTVDNLASEGMGIASDVGLMLSAPVMLLPTLAVVLRDAGGTTYGVKDKLLTGASTNPASTKQSLDAGFALFPIMGKGVRGTFTAEMRDIMTEDDLEKKEPMRRVHVGTELNIRDAFFFRVGMNQQYWTAGMELAVLNYQLQMAAYGEDIGTTTTAREDRRYVVKFSYRF